ncbi:FAR1-related sequence 5-like protein [Tanacetum coccineum]
MKARTLISHGCQGFLASVMDTSLESPNIENLSVPQLALTDQDAALRNAVVKMFPDSTHRLCMWHITQKLPGKVLGDLEADSEFWKEYNFQDNKWLSDMYAIRDRWIPGYFKDYPMCGLMKTTSLFESSNAFSIFFHIKISSHSEVKEIKKQLEAKMQTSNYDNNKEALYADLLGVTVPEQVVIKNPKKSSKKGSKRRKSAAAEVKANKKPRTTRKVPFKRRACGKCGGKGHNRRKCTSKNVMEEDEIQKVDSEDEFDEEDEIQDVDEDYESDEDNASGEDNASDEDASAEVESDEDESDKD